MVVTPDHILLPRLVHSRLGLAVTIYAPCIVHGFLARIRVGRNVQLICGESVKDAVVPRLSLHS